MEKFLLQLLGTNDYQMVVVGFIFALFGMGCFYMFSEKKITWDILLKNLFAIVLVMRFSKMVIDFIPMQNVPKDDLTAYIGVLVGLMCEAIPQFTIKKVNMLKKKISKTDQTR